MRNFVPVLLCVVGMAGCIDGTRPVSPDQASQPMVRAASTSADGTDVPEEADRPEERLSREMARAVPGFGGFSTDSTGALIIYLAQPGNGAHEKAARSLVGEYHRQHARLMRQRGQGAEIVIRKADYTFAQLSRYRRRVNDEVLLTQGVRFTDLDELRNRFVIGLDHAQAAGAQGAIQQILHRAGVPEAAVEYKVLSLYTPVDACRVDDLYCEVDPCDRNPLDPACSGEEPAPLPATIAGTDIRSKVRPMLGGIQVKNGYSSAVGTLGFVAYYCVDADVSSTYAGRCGYWYVVTSHQTTVMARVTGEDFWQPDNFFDGEKVAVEAIDTRWHTVPFPISVPDLPAGSTCEEKLNYRSLVCRRSDMALLRPTTRDFVFGFLARPKRRHSNNYYYGDEQFAIDQTNSRMRIINEVQLGVGAVVDKIGITTGWRSGQITGVCVDMLRIPNDVNNDLQRYVLRCQTQMRIHSQRGDSGGPVFWYHSDGTVSLAGLLHGEAYRPVGEYSYYSPMSMIRNDLGLPYNDRLNFNVHPVN